MTKIRYHLKSIKLRTAIDLRKFKVDFDLAVGVLKEIDLDSTQRIRFSGTVEVHEHEFAIIITKPLTDDQINVAVRWFGRIFSNKSALKGFVRHYHYNEDKTERSGQLFIRVKE